MEDNKEVVKEEVKQENKSNEKKKSKKKIIITIILIVVILFLLIAGFIFYHGNQLGTLIAEVNKIAEIQMTDESGNLIENPLDTEIKTKGSYAVIEKTFKDYMSEVVTSTQNLIKAFNGDKMANFLTIENIKEDGPDFTNTKQEISTMRQALNDFNATVDEYFDEEKLLAKIDDKDISDYYKELYKRLAVDEESSKQLKENMEKIEDSEKILEDSLGYLEKIINYLSDNKDYWQIINDQIIFTSQDKLNEYTEMALDVPDSLQ